jgi:hypothetical protein
MKQDLKRVLLKHATTVLLLLLLGDFYVYMKQDGRNETTASGWV